MCVVKHTKVAIIQHDFQLITFYAFLAVPLDDNDILLNRNWKCKLLNTRFQVQVFEKESIIVSVSQWRYVQCSRSDALQRDIANYWPGKHNTVL